MKVGVVMEILEEARTVFSVSFLKENAATMASHGVQIDDRDGGQGIEEVGCFKVTVRNIVKGKFFQYLDKTGKDFMLGIRIVFGQLQAMPYIVGIEIFRDEITCESQGAEALFEHSDRFGS